MISRTLLALLCFGTISNGDRNDNERNFSESITQPLLTLSSSSSPTSSSITALISPKDYSIPPFFSPNETEHISSVTVRLYCSNPSATIYFTSDGSTPNHLSSTATSGSPILIDESGETFMKAFSSVPGLVDSFIVSKRYVVLERCQRPSISPNGGTFAGSVSVTLQSGTSGAKIYYVISADDSPVGQPNAKTSPSILNGQSLTLKQGAAKLRIFAMAARSGFADSSVADAVFHILPKVVAPTILPHNEVFTISATLTFSCETPNSTIYFTTDGSEPTQSSLVIASGGSVVIEEAGQHTVKAYATEQRMLPSDITSKSFTILERTSAPVFHPSPGFSYIDDLAVSFQCEADVVDGFVYFTLDGFSTPSLASSRVACGGAIALAAPGRYTVRAFATSEDRSPSAIVQGLFTLLRRPYDESEVFVGEVQATEPVIAVNAIEKTFASSGNAYTESKYIDSDSIAAATLAGSGVRLVSGRLVVLSNPLEHFDVLEPADGCGGSGGLNLVSDLVQGSSSYSSSMNRQPRSASISTVINDFRLRDEDAWVGLSEPEGSQQAESVGQQPQQQRCVVAMSGGFFNTSTSRCIGNVVSGGVLVQSSSSRNVNLGLRNGSFVTGYLSSVSDDFASLVSGVGWLVRGGEAYISESVEVDGEDLSPLLQGLGLGQEQDAMSAVTARSVVGHDLAGRLLLLQVDGVEGASGATLHELADLAVELGFHSAINLVGGVHSALVINGTLVSEPTGQCIASGSKDKTPGHHLFRCEAPVATVLCIRSSKQATEAPSLAPTPIPTRLPTPTPTAPPSAYPSAPPSATPSMVPSSSPSASASATPGPTPSWWYPGDPAAATGSGSDEAVNQMMADAFSNSTYIGRISILTEEVHFYQLCTYALAALLSASVIAHVCMYLRNRNKMRKEFGSTGRHGDQYALPVTGLPGGEGGVEVVQLPPNMRHMAGSRHPGQEVAYARGAGVQDAEDGARSAFTLSGTARANQPPTQNWQQQLGAMKFSIESDSDGDGDENGGDVETVQLYSTYLPQSQGQGQGQSQVRGATRPSKPSRPTTRPSKEKKQGSSGGKPGKKRWGGPSDGIPYAQVGSSEDEDHGSSRHDDDREGDGDGGLNPFHSKPRRNW